MTSRSWRGRRFRRHDRRRESAISRLPAAIWPSAPFRRVMGRAMPRKEKITDATSEITTTIAIIRLTRVAFAPASTTSCLAASMFFARGRNRGFHQLAGLGNDIYRTICNDIGLQVLGLHDVAHWRQGIASRWSPAIDPAAKFLVVHLVPRRLQDLLERSLDRSDPSRDVGFAGDAVAPDCSAHRVHAGVGLIQQLFNVAAIIQLGQCRRRQLGCEGLAPFSRDRRPLVDLREQIALRLREFLVPAA